MKKFLLIVFCLLVSCVHIEQTYAIVNPLLVPNNKIGIHILFPDEISDAAALVNSSGGDWGYVTIPIQAGDRDLEKWQKFMDMCKKLHVIPLLRLATEGDYFNTKVWRKPNDADILDFANFLSSLSWPVKNKYIIVFNEPNRANEWGDEVSAQEYARELSYAVTVFKSKSSDFFILSAGFDNAAISTSSSQNEYSYMTAMDKEVPGIFYQIDGLASHSYPNPAFSKPPQVQDNESIASFRFEKEFIKSLGSNDLPVFITETGWSTQAVSDDTASSYYTDAFSSIWSDSSLVAVTPFLLRANVGSFTFFSFLKPDSTQTKEYSAVFSLQKVKGTPVLSESVLGEHKAPSEPVSQQFPIKRQTANEKISIPTAIKNLFKWLLKI